MGSVTVGETAHFWAAPFEQDGEFGALGYPHPMPEDATAIRLKFAERHRAGANTVIGAVATDARLTKAQAKRLAIAAHTGIAKAVWPSHTPHDGDTIFVLSTGTGPEPSPLAWIELCAQAAATTARAVARSVWAAEPADGDLMPAWRAKFGASNA